MSSSAMTTEQVSGVTDVLEAERALEARLLSKFSRLRPDVVRGCLRDAAAQFEGARVRNFLAVLIERAATDRLRVVEHEVRGVPEPRAEASATSRDFTDLEGSPDSADRNMIDRTRLRRRGRRGGAVVSGPAPA